MPDEIQPALTPEEWRIRILKDRFGINDLLWGERETGTVALDNSGYEYTPENVPAVKVMALANDALPDDDPRKITREDVRQLEARGVRSTHDDEDNDEFIIGLAARLAALLPPNK